MFSPTFPQLAAPHGLFYGYDQLCFAQNLAAGLAAPLWLPQGGLSRWYFYYRPIKKQKAVFFHPCPPSTILRQLSKMLGKQIDCPAVGKAGLCGKNRFLQFLDHCLVI
jgi:hypothetical protein